MLIQVVKLGVGESTQFIRHYGDLIWWEVDVDCEACLGAILDAVLGNALLD